MVVRYLRWGGDARLLAILACVYCVVAEAGRREGVEGGGVFVLQGILAAATGTICVGAIEFPRENGGIY